MTLQKAIEKHLAAWDEGWSDVQAHNLNDELLSRQISEAFGSGNFDGDYVLAWTPTRVVTVREYDGSEWVDSLPRNPPTISRGG